MELGLKQLGEKRLQALKMIFTRTTDYTKLDHEQDEQMFEQLKITNHQIYTKL